MVAQSARHTHKRRTLPCGKPPFLQFVIHSADLIRHATPLKSRSVVAVVGCPCYYYCWGQHGSLFAPWIDIMGDSFSFFLPPNHEITSSPTPVFEVPTEFFFSRRHMDKTTRWIGRLPFCVPLPATPGRLWFLTRDG